MYICFGMERTFIKRDTKNQKLLAGDSLSPVVLGYIADGHTDSIVVNAKK